MQPKVRMSLVRPDCAGFQLQTPQSAEFEAEHECFLQRPGRTPVRSRWDVSVSRLSRLLLLALWNGTKNKGGLDVESVSLGLFLFVVRLTFVIIILHIAVVGGGVEGGRRRGRYRVGPRVAEALRL